MEATKSVKITIAQVLEEFLADQTDRISTKTLAKYQTIISLYQSYLESYWPDHDGEASKITGAGGTYCGTFGAEEAANGFSEFLGYFMPRKVMCGKETMQAAGTVTKKLAKWLGEKGYLANPETALEEAGDIGKALSNTPDVFDLLIDCCDFEAPANAGQTIQDHFLIEKIEPGQLWLTPLTASNSEIGPIRVPKKVTTLCELGWDIGGVVAKVGKTWRFLEVWNVSP